MSTILYKKNNNPSNTSKKKTVQKKVDSTDKVKNTVEEVKYASYKSKANISEFENVKKENNDKNLLEEKLIKEKSLEEHNEKMNNEKHLKNIEEFDRRARTEMPSMNIFRIGLFLIFAILFLLFLLKTDPSSLSSKGIILGIVILFIVFIIARKQNNIFSE